MFAISECPHPKPHFCSRGPDSSSAVAKPQIGLLRLYLLVSVGFVQFGGGNHVNYYRIEIHMTRIP